jgi:hypothetical protein
VADVTWDQLSPAQQAVLAEAADDLEVEIWELVAPGKVIFIGGDRSFVIEPADIDVVRAAVRLLQSHGLIAIGRRAGDGDLAAVPDDALDDPRTWDPHTGRDLVIYATERGDDLYDEVLPRPKGPMQP